MPGTANAQRRNRDEEIVRKTLKSHFQRSQGESSYPSSPAKVVGIDLLEIQTPARIDLVGNDNLRTPVLVESNKWTDDAAL